MTENTEIFLLKSIEVKNVLISGIIAPSKEMPNDREITVKIAEPIRNVRGNNG